jgi:riboflavin synthase
MFTGIIEYIGTVKAVDSRSLEIEPPETGDSFEIGESVAVNGCCLTVVAATGTLRFEMSEETLRRTALGLLTSGSPVNLERAMRADSRFGGHMVQGHVDGTGQLVSVEETPQAHILRFSYPKESAKYVIEKGSITVDGISLTAVAPTDSEFEVWIIPHTWSNTNLASMRVGQRVNLEFDMVAKYVERILGSR